jgi:hypothetical protein
MENAMDHFTCPECGLSVPVPAQPLRVRVECPHCHEIVLVPRGMRGQRPPRSGAEGTECGADPQDSGLLLWLGDGLRSTSLATRACDRHAADSSLKR